MVELTRRSPEAWRESPPTAVFTYDDADVACQKVPITLRRTKPPFARPAGYDDLPLALRTTTPKTSNRSTLSAPSGHDVRLRHGPNLFASSTPLSTNVSVRRRVPSRISPTPLATSPPRSSTPRYTFTAQEFISVIDTYYYDARWYDSAIGQFLSADPIDADQANTYRGMGNDPVNSTDPTGLDSIAVDGNRVFWERSATEPGSATGARILSLFGEEPIDDSSKLFRWQIGTVTESGWVKIKYSNAEIPLETLRAYAKYNSFVRAQFKSEKGEALDSKFEKHFSRNVAVDWQMRYNAFMAEKNSIMSERIYLDDYAKVVEGVKRKELAAGVMAHVRSGIRSRLDGKSPRKFAVGAIEKEMFKNLREQSPIADRILQGKDWIDTAKKLKKGSIAGLAQSVAEKMVRAIGNMANLPSDIKVTSLDDVGGGKISMEFSGKGKHLGGKLVNRSDIVIINRRGFKPQTGLFVSEDINTGVTWGEAHDFLRTSFESALWARFLKNVESRMAREQAAAINAVITLPVPFILPLP